MQKLIVGKNDFLTLYPDLAQEWSKKNSPLQPNMVLPFSQRSVWWKCSNNHEWQARISDRSHGCNCPYCSNKRVLVGYNDLKTINPILCEDWDYEKNTISPENVTPHSGKKVWWKCREGHSWEASIAHRSDGRGCPICSRNKAAKHLIQYYSQNGSGTFADKHPELLDEWDFDKNVNLTPSQISPVSGQKVWWRCKICGYQWQSLVSNRVNGNGCPRCSFSYQTSYSEQIIYYYIHQWFADSINSYKASWLGKRELDIFVPSLNLAIEYDGQAFHGNVNRDLEKNKTIK